MQVCLDRSPCSSVGYSLHSLNIIFISPSSSNFPASLCFIILHIAVGLFYDAGANYGILRALEFPPGERVELGAKHSRHYIHRRLKSTEQTQHTRHRDKQSQEEYNKKSTQKCIIFPLSVCFDLNPLPLLDMCYYLKNIVLLVHTNENYNGTERVSSFIQSSVSFGSSRLFYFQCPIIFCIIHFMFSTCNSNQNLYIYSEFTSHKHLSIRNCMNIHFEHMAIFILH